MSLDKKDFEQIEKVVEKVVEKSENRIISIISREVNDLAETNRAIIQKVDTIAELDKRIYRIETKMGIAP